MKKHSITTNLAGPWKAKDGFATAPITIIKEGVACGSDGCIYWDGRILKENAKKWNNVPVTFNHPTINKVPVSIRHSAQVFNKYAIGRLHNVYFDEKDKSIKGIVHIPLTSPRLSDVQSAHEVSMGVFSDQTYETGNYNGKQYSACAISMKPDHVAILPAGTKGACSWQDGCGIRINEKIVTIFEKALNKLIALRGGNEMADDEPEVLLPPEFNKPTHEPGGSGTDEVLLPIGFGNNANK